MSVRKAVKYCRKVYWVFMVTNSRVYNTNILIIVDLKIKYKSTETRDD